MRSGSVSGGNWKARDRRASSGRSRRRRRSTTLEPTNTDDVYTIAEFTENVNSGGFIDYDGYGTLGNETATTYAYEVRPSNFKKLIDNLPKTEQARCTHIHWYNR